MTNAHAGAISAADRIAPPQVQGGDHPQSISGADVLSGTSTADYKTAIGAMSQIGGNFGSDAERTILNQLSIDGLSDTRLTAVKSNLDQFERNATASGMSPDKVQETFRQMGRILSSDGRLVNRELTDKFIEQWSSKLADPSTVKQGWHDTCGIASFEASKLQTDPDRLTRVIADAMVDGRTTVADDSRSYLGHFFFSRKPDGDKKRTISFDADLFKPDSEAKGNSIHGDARDYADEVAQNTLNRIKWDLNETSPNNTWTTQGSMKFKQCEKVERPSDTVPANPSADKSCESIEFTDPFGTKTTFDGAGYGFGGQTSEADLNRLNDVLQGDHRDFVIRGGADNIGTEEQFKSMLELLQAGKVLPAIAFVHPSMPGIREDYLKRHPEKTDVSPNTMWHLVKLDRVNEDGTVRMFNPWGVTKNISMHDLYNAIKGPKKD